MRLLPPPTGMRNYTLTGDQDRALAMNMFASLQNSDPDATTKTGSEALILSLLQGGANASPSNNPDVAGRINAIAALQNSGGADPSTLYRDISKSLLKDYTPIRAQGRTMSRAIDPMQAIASLQNDHDFLSLPTEHQDRVIEGRGGAQALRAMKFMRALTEAKASQQQRMALKNIEDEADAKQSPRRMIQTLFQTGKLMVMPGRGLVHKVPSLISGEEKWEDAPPWLLGHAAKESPGLGFGEIPLSPAAKLGMEMHANNPQLSADQIKEAVKQKMSGTAAPGAPANGPARIPAPTTFNPRQVGSGIGDVLKEVPASLQDILRQRTMFTGSALQNIGRGTANTASGAVNMAAGMFGAGSDITPYVPYTTPEKMQADMPEWLRRALTNYPIPLP